MEVFGNGGRVVITDRVFPRLESSDVEVFADGGQAVLKMLDVYELDAAAFLSNPEGAPAVEEE